MRLLRESFKILILFMLGSLCMLSWINLDKTPEASCGRFPTEKHITYDNVVWQVLDFPKFGFIKLLNAHLDERQNQTVVRVIVMVSSADIEKETVYCQFWFEDGPEPVYVMAKDYKVLHWYKTRRNETFLWPYFINCPVPKALKAQPTSVSLVANPCDYAENNLKIINNQPADGVKKEFAVCYKSATYTDPDFAIRFIEWVQWMRILGVEKIYFTYRYIHPKIFEAVKYFESQGIVETWPYYEPSGINTENKATQKQLLEESSLNDCFYRVRNLYKYVAILDFDEIIVPLNESDRSWSDLIEKYNMSFPDAINFNVYLIAHNVTDTKDVPKNLYTLRNIYLYTWNYGPGKSFFKTKDLYVVNNHMPLACIGRNCVSKYMNYKIAKTFHYRDNVTERENTRSVQMNEVFKFKNELIYRVDKTLKALERF